MDPESPPLPERGLLTLSDAAWAQAVQRSQVIAPLAALPVVGRGTGAAPLLPEPPAPVIARRV
jgi:hypothetical protein